jgi:hypothetical protein
MSDMLTRLRRYQKVWGHLPSIAPHLAEAPGFKTGTVILDAEDAATRIEELENKLKAAGYRPIDDVPDEDVILFFPAKISAFGKVDLSAMRKVGRASDFPNRKPTHWAPLPPDPV